MSRINVKWFTSSLNKVQADSSLLGRGKFELVSECECVKVDYKVFSYDSKLFLQFSIGNREKTFEIESTRIELTNSTRYYFKCDTQRANVQFLYVQNEKVLTRYDFTEPVYPSRLDFGKQRAINSKWRNQKKAERLLNTVKRSHHNGNETALQKRIKNLMNRASYYDQKAVFMIGLG